jgi:hypothetical protein
VARNSSLPSRAGSALLDGRLGHQRPHVAKCNQPEEMHVIGRGGARIVGLGHGVLHQPHGRGLKIIQALLESLCVERQLFIAAVFLAEVTDFLEEGHHRAAAVLAELAAHQIERLDAVRTLIDHGDAGVADILAHAPFLDIAVSAEHLLRHHRMVESLVGEHALDHRRDQCQQVVRLLLLALDFGAVGDVRFQRGPQHERASCLVEGADGHQRAAHVGMNDDRISLLLRRLGAGKRAALKPFAGIVDGILIGDFTHRLTLKANTETGFVHHHEHGLEAGVFRTDQIPGRLVVIHHAGGVSVNAHLLFKRAAGDRIALAQRTVVANHEFRHDEQRNALHPFRRAFDAGQNQMDDVVGHVVLAGRDENLLAGNLVAAVILPDRLGPQQAQIGAAMRLGQVHGAGPYPFHHLRQKPGFLLIGAMLVDCRDRALGQAGIHHQRQVCGGHVLANRHMQGIGQALAAIFRGCRQSQPAAFAILLVGFLEPLRSRHGGVVVPGAAFPVANLVERQHHLFREPGAFLQDGLNDVRARVGEAGKVHVALVSEHIV